MKGLIIIEFDWQDMAMIRALRTLKEQKFKVLYANPHKEECQMITDLIPEKP